MSFHFLSLSVFLSASCGGGRCVCCEVNWGVKIKICGKEMLQLYLSSLNLYQTCTENFWLALLLCMCPYYYYFFIRSCY